jgi:hypothetical protein
VIFANPALDLIAAGLVLEVGVDGGVQLGDAEFNPPKAVASCQDARKVKLGLVTACAYPVSVEQALRIYQHWCISEINAKGY